jgi:biotin transport system substrate-specific component
MQNISAIDGFIQLRYSFFKWRTGAGLAQKAGLAICMACVIGLTAQLRFPLPWTPVPVVCSTLGVVLAGILLGRLWGGISVFIYAAAGFMGVPWFAGFKGGAAALFGPTGGYIIGFILSALLVGYFTDTYIKSRKMIPMFGIVLFAHMVLMYVPGMIVLGWWLEMCGKTFTFTQLLWMGAIPFIPGDIIKSLIAAGMAGAITPKQSYSNETDRERK